MKQSVVKYPREPKIKGLKTSHAIELLIILLSYILAGGAVAQEVTPKGIKLYIDADFTNARTSSISIERGIRTALSEVGNLLEGYTVEIVKKDHRGNTRRSQDNLSDFISDKRALAVFCGLHSPPVLANLEFINTQGVLLLDPWAAAGPITRYSNGDNWVFRLSVDDTKAGFVMVEHAVKRGFNRPFLLLEDTVWGKSNERTMIKALHEHDKIPAGILWFNWGLKERGARILLREILETGADTILMVANAPEAKVFCRAFLSLEVNKKIPIISHWGLTGGDFPQNISHDQRQLLDLTFLQTRFSFVSNPEDNYGKQVFQRVRKLYPKSIESVGDIKAPSGFIHAYDLTRLLIAAVQESGLTGDITQDRERIRNGLEHLQQPVKGLIKTYITPFQPFEAHTPDAHEALGKKDLIMGRYNKNNEIVLIGREKP
ncbi:MAG: ABC transporter substrate-binding protein [Desulfobulbaceae bacterium]|nr:ABC transporter substrate-binding protein [Desulfobulbaceae bacterium]